MNILAEHLEKTDSLTIFFFFFCLLWACVYLCTTVGFQDGSVGKESTCNAGDTGDADFIPGLGRSPWRRNGNPLQYFFPRESCGQRSLQSQRIRYDWSNWVCTHTQLQLLGLLTSLHFDFIHSCCSEGRKHRSLLLPVAGVQAEWDGDGNKVRGEKRLGEARSGGGRLADAGVQFSMKPREEVWWSRGAERMTPSGNRNRGPWK